MDDDTRAYLAQRHRPIGPAHVAAVTRYSDGAGLPGSGRVNNGLRAVIPLSLAAERDAMLLDEAIDRQQRLTRDVVLWRAVGPNGIARLRQGVKDHGFVSASTSRAHVEREYVGRGSILLAVRVPMGWKVLHMPSVGTGGTLGQEDEVLLPRGTTLQVVGTRSDGVIEVIVT